MSYAAANSFMDAFAHDRNRNGSFKWISATWDAWPLDKSMTSELHRSIDAFAMTYEESVEAFKRITSASTMSQVIVSTGDLYARAKRWIQFEQKIEPVEDKRSDYGVELPLNKKG